MNRYFTILAAAALFCGSLQAQAADQPSLRPSVESRIERAKKNMLVGIRLENEGVVEAIIYRMALIKMRYPATDFSKLQSILDDYAISYPIERIRYKAYIVSNILHDPSWYARDESLTQAQVESFFTLAAVRLQDKLLGANTY
jgi:hypothetical protein